MALVSGSPLAIANIQSYTYIQNGRINAFKALVEQFGAPLIQSLDLGLLTHYAASFGSLENMIELLKMGIPVELEPLNQTLAYNLQYLYPYSFTRPIFLNQIKFILFLITQPGAPALAVRPEIAAFLRDPRARPGLLQVLGEINSFVRLESEQTQPIREYLAQAGVENVAELIKDGIKANATFRRTHALALRTPAPAAENMGASGGKANKKGGRRKTKRRRISRKYRK